MIAAQRGHAACVSIFLNHPDIQVNLQDEVIFCCSFRRLCFYYSHFQDGNTALHHSIECFPTDHWENPTNYSNDVSLLIILVSPLFVFKLERESYQSCLETLLRCEAVNIFILNHVNTNLVLNIFP